MDKLVLVLGLAMVGLSNYTNGNLAEVWSLVSDPNSKYKTIQNQRSLLVIAGELIFVFILASFAGASDAAGGAIVAFLVVVALLWSMKHPTDLSHLSSIFQGK